MVFFSRVAQFQNIVVKRVRLSVLPTKKHASTLSETIHYYGI